jgi:hypothetical protein
MAILLSAVCFLLWNNTQRMRHAQAVSGVAEAAATTTQWQPRLIVPEHNNSSYQWLAQVRQSMDRDELRMRHVEYENAPFGRVAYASSAYQWWLRMIAWFDQRISAVPAGASLERAALIADPLLHVLLLLGTSVCVAWRFGAWPAALLSVGVVMVFPFAAEFLPAMPDDRGLIHTFSLWSVLLLLGGIRGCTFGRMDISGDSEKSADVLIGGSVRPWFFFAGVVGGFGLWVSVAHQLPILCGIALGALFSAWLTRRHLNGDAAGGPVLLPWREWGLGGAITVLLSYLMEFFPNHLASWQLRAIHPLYGVAWLGGGELLAQVTGWIERGKVGGRIRSWRSQRCLLRCGNSDRLVFSRSICRPCVSYDCPAARRQPIRSAGSPARESPGQSSRRLHR